jgi:hypothetical protein
MKQVVRMREMIRARAYNILVSKPRENILRRGFEDNIKMNVAEMLYGGVYLCTQWWAFDINENREFPEQMSNYHSFNGDRVPWSEISHWRRR